ncbi:UNVERIFIED_CONTAM: peptidoglycan-binding protein, partial [Salmonella enterica subsp. enterica serovar Weltevreden]
TNAVKVFQRANALKQTGVTDAVTLGLLKSKADYQRAAAAEKSSTYKHAEHHSEHSSSTSRSTARPARSTPSDVSTSGIAGSCQASFYDDSQT